MYVYRIILEYCTTITIIITLDFYSDLLVDTIDIDCSVQNNPRILYNNNDNDNSGFL